MKTIDGYEIVGLLGRGGMGGVYKVRIPVVGKITALKLLKPQEHLADLVGMEELKRQFLQEAKLMAAFSHPHIAQIWNYGYADGLPYYIMEYYCNDLGTVIGERYRADEVTRRLRTDMAVKYTLHTLEGLRRLHTAGIVHRDVKPFNLMLTNEDTVKIIDFGLSKLRGEEASNAPKNVKIGTPYNTSPEQEDDPEAADARSDLFSVGVMLFRMLTGKMPHNTETDALLSAQEMEKLLKEADPSLTEEWTEMFASVLAEDPEKRFADARSMMAALRRLVRKWEEQAENTCVLDEGNEEKRVQCITHLRNTPTKTGPKPVEEAFAGENGLDALGKPLKPCDNDFMLDRCTVLDRATGLIWQQSGSEYPMNQTEAQEYIRELNDEKFQGYSDWRLPTVEEAATLIEAEPSMEDFCLDPMFESTQNIIWTSDRRSYVSYWYLNTAMGFIGSQDETCRFYARAVVGKGVE